MISMKYDELKIKNQLCHPLYSAANSIVRAYEPHLKGVGLTYPQYLVMLSLWEEDGVSISNISENTFFDSGSLTPLLRRLSEKGFISVSTSEKDQRQKVVQLTKRGEKLKDQVHALIPRLGACYSSLSKDEIGTLRKILHKLLPK